VKHGGVSRLSSAPLRALKSGDHGPLVYALALRRIRDTARRCSGNHHEPENNRKTGAFSMACPSCAAEAGLPHLRCTGSKRAVQRTGPALWRTNRISLNNEVMPCELLI
jgi:hypothetical protein